MDGILARSADHEGLPPFGCHDRRPCWFVGSGLTEPREFGDVVDHHGARLLTQLAPAPHEPVDDLLAGIGHPNRSTISDDRALVPCEGYPAEPSYQILLAGAEYKDMEPAVTASQIKPGLNLVNTGSAAVLVAPDPALRETLSGLSNITLFRRCTELRPTTSSDVTSAAVYTLRLLACRIQELTAEIRDLEHRITDAVTAHTPALLERPGFGPDSAAALLVTARDNPDRLHSEGPFAALCGASPIEAFSGKTPRRRLNRGGDRQANAALYRIALPRLRWDQRTRDYLDRRAAEGKTRRETIRCLTRYIAREIYYVITNPTPTSGARPQPRRRLTSIGASTHHTASPRSPTGAPTTGSSWSTRPPTPPG